MQKHQRLALGWVFLGAVTVSTSVSAETKATCPPGQRPSVNGCVEGSRHAQFRSVGEAARQSVRSDTVPTPDVDSGIAPAKRPRLEMARRTLLLQELRQLERVFAATPKNARDRPNILRRLAEGYAELEALSERERIERELLAESAKRESEATSGSVVKDTEPPRPTKPAPKTRRRSTTLL